MRHLAIIQARCGSTRLPNKVLQDVCGLSAIERMLNRVSRSKLVDEFIVATTINKEDTEIVKTVSNLGYRVFVGSSSDVLDRYYQAAKLIKPEYVIRLTADCPLLDWRLIDKAINSMKPESDDLYMLTETYPDGEDIEIVRFEALERAWKSARLASEREHVTIYIKNHPDLFKLQDFVYEGDNMNAERWTLDEAEDLELIRAVYKHFAPNDDFTIEEIFEYLHGTEEGKKTWELNRAYARNEGLAKSLREDHVVDIVS